MKRQAASRRFLILFLAWTIPGAAASIHAQPPAVTTVLVTAGLDEATIGLTHAGDGSGRLFAVAQTGVIRIFDGTDVLPTPFLDIGDRILSGSERGLLGLAFHPDFATNGFFYVYYSETPSGDSVIARFSVSADPDVALPGSETTVLRFAQTAGNHNAGDLHFGPDGFLYIASGDGGGDWCDAQDGGNLLGAILRIDVDGDDFPMDADANYAIPADNPFVGVAGTADEIWALGLRNPWRFSFDRKNGDLFIGDVGEGAREEWNRLPAGIGGVNLGWPWFEGDAAFTTCAAPAGAPFASCSSAPFTCPILVLDQATSGACSAIGGYRYRGDGFPGLEGIYFYTDWCEGVLHAAVEEGSSWTTYDVATPGFGVTGFGEDETGELYFVNGPTLFQITGDGFTVFTDGFESGGITRWTTHQNPPI